MTTDVLILEADKKTAAQIQSIAESVECRVVGLASDSKAACRIAKKNPIDLFIGDILSTDAPEAIERCRLLQQQQNFSIILITDVFDAQTIKQLAPLNINGCLIKPIDRVNLETLIHIVIFRKTVVDDECFFFDSVYCYCLKCATLFQEKNAVTLNEKEHRLMLALAECGGVLLSHQVMEHRVWEGKAISPGVRRQFIYRFKSKVPYFPLKLIKGLGYRIEKVEDET